MIIENEPADIYHASPAWGSSRACVFRRSPQEAHDEMTGLKVRIDRGCLQVGRLAHMMVLEPDRFAQQVVDEGPIHEKTGRPFGRDTQAFARWQAEHPEKVVVEPWLYTMLGRMPAAIREILQCGKPEVTVRVEADDQHPAMQCRPDWNRDLQHVWDLKTIDSLEQIDKAILNFNYWIKAGWYERTIQRETGSRPRSFEFIFCEKACPWRWQIVTLAEDYREEGYIAACDLARDIRDAELVGDFTDHYDIHRVVPMPSWMGEITQNEDGSISL